MTSEHVKIYLPLILGLIAFPQLGETIYTPSLPELAHAFLVTENLAQLTISTFFIGSAFGMLFWGGHSDKVGRRRAMISGLIVYIIGCTMCLASRDIDQLLISRFIQAFGAASGGVLSQTIIRDALSERERAKIFSIITMGLAITPGIGPLIGGFSASYFGWVSSFYILFFVGIILLLFSIFFLNETKKDFNIKTKSIDDLSLFTVTKLFMRDKVILGLCFIVGAVFGIVFSFYAEAPFIFINILQVKVDNYGMIGLVIALSYVIGAEISRRMNINNKSVTIIAYGCWIILFGALLLLAFDLSGCISLAFGNLAYMAIIFPMFIIFIGIGIAIPNSLNIALVNYEKALGLAGSLFTFGYTALIAFFTYIMSCFHAQTATPMVACFVILALLILAVYYSIVRSEACKNK